jgi:hypothetical protein
MYRHFRGTHQLFAEIFSGMDDPVAALYATLGGLATGGKAVQAAEEPDGEKYGPAM